MAQQPRALGLPVPSVRRWSGKSTGRWGVEIEFASMAVLCGNSSWPPNPPGQEGASEGNAVAALSHPTLGRGVFFGSLKARLEADISPGSGAERGPTAEVLLEGTLWALPDGDRLLPTEIFHPWNVLGLPSSTVRLIRTGWQHREVTSGRRLSVGSYVLIQFDRGPIWLLSYVESLCAGPLVKRPGGHFFKWLSVVRPGRALRKKLPGRGRTA